MKIELVSSNEKADDIEDFDFVDDEEIINKDENSIDNNLDNE